MPTIKQLPLATSVSATDVLPISQGGTTKGLTVGGLLSSTQAALALAPGKLLGRVSTVAGGPEALGVGSGLALDASGLSATGDDHTRLPVASGLGVGDEVVVNSGGTPKRLAASALRGLFNAGPGVTISGGTISATSGGTYSLPVASTAALGGVKVDGSSVVVNGSGVISSTIPLPVVYGGTSTPQSIPGQGASMTLQNGNIGFADIPSAPEAYDGFRSVLCLQPGSNVVQASAVGGYVLNRTPADTARGKNAAVGLWAESVADVEGAQSWGIAVHVHDGISPGTGAGRLVINEIDVGVNHTNTIAIGLSLTAGFSVQPGSADGYLIGSFSDSTRWVNGFRTFPGSAMTAFRIGPVAGTGAVGSQPISFDSTDAGGASRSARLQTDPDGTLIATGLGFTAQSVSGVPLLRATGAGLLVGASGNVAAHAGNLGAGLAYDGSAFVATGAPLASPAFSGIPTAPTAPLGTNTGQIATMAAVKAAVDGIVAGAPGALDTLNEIAGQLAADESAASVLTVAVSGKLAKSGNLGDLASAPAARANLGLGGAAVLGVGTGAGSVAAGDDSRIVGAQSAAQVTAAIGSALTGLAPITAAPTAGALTGSERIGMSQAGADASLGLSALASAVGAILAAPVLTQPTATRVYQRDSVVGGAFGRGAGTVGVTVVLGVPVTLLEYRLRDAAAVGTVLLNWTTLATNLAAGSNALLPSIPASASRYLIDVRANGYMPGAQLGTQAFGVGEVVAVLGQSLAADLFGSTNNDVGTSFASAGTTAPPTTGIYASWNGTVNVPPGWGTSSNGGPYSGAFIAEFSRLAAGALGVVVGFAGYANNGFDVASFAAGQPANTYWHQNVTAATGGKFGGLFWLQGHANAIAGTSQASYLSQLGTVLADLAGSSSLAPVRVLSSIPAITVTSQGTAQAIQAIRAAQVQYVTTNSATSAHVDGLSATLYDGVHPTQAGHVQLAREFYRKWSALRGLAAAKAAPRVIAASRSAGSNQVVLTISNGGTALSGLYAPGTAGQRSATAAEMASQFQVFASPVAYASGVPQAAVGVTGAALTSATTITLTLASTPADGVALDVFVRMPTDTSMAVATSIVDNQTDGDGLTFGRALALGVGAVTASAPGVSAAGVPVVTATASGSSGVNLSIGAGPGGTPSSYAVQMSTSSSFSTGVTTLNGSLAYAGTATTLAASGLVASTTYYFRATASNAGGTSGQSSIVSATTSAASSYPVLSGASLLAAHDAAAGVSTSGSNITSVADQSGSGNGLVGVAGSYPTLTSNWVNSQPGFAFTGGKKLTAAPGASWMSGTSGMQGIVTGLLVLAGTADAGVPLSAGVSGSGSLVNDLYIQANSGNSLQLARSAAGANYVNSANAGSGLWKLAYRINYSAGSAELWVNGLSKVSFSFAAAASPPAWDWFALGVFTNGGFGFTGTIGLNLIYNGAASDAEIASLQAYATGRFGS